MTEWTLFDQVVHQCLVTIYTVVQVLSVQSVKVKPTVNESKQSTKDEH